MDHPNVICIQNQKELKMKNLKGLKVAILITDGFEEVEMVTPRKALDDAGAETRIVSPKHKTVRAWDLTEWSKEY
jgi:protease I